ncbi:hypothetical protein ACIQFU_19710 [Streptomyces sp. NPDC093065]|uniref:hypothetical protein n=1 Tax=Streptomyces sp. NPDC093065 TaxID=3366021 RepID=UPI00382317E8
MAWEEWEQVKAAVSTGRTAQMQLNQLPADRGGTGTAGGGPVGRMRSDKATWSGAGGALGELQESLGKALARLADGQTGLGKESGCLTAAVQERVYESWERRVKDISELCDGLAEVFEKTGNDQLRTDEAIKAEIARLKVASGDPADGGSGKGR